MLRAINTRLSIPVRLFLIGCLFAAPIAFLVYLLVTQSRGDIDFAARELDGSHYLDNVWPGFIKTAVQNTPVAGDIPDRATFDAEFNTGATSGPYLEAKTVTDKLSAGATLIGNIADNSNLTLDPDLDSFYAMDAATVRLPGVISAAVALKAAYAEPASTKSRVVDIAYAASHLETYANDAQSSLGSSIKNNAAGDTARALSARADAFKIAAQVVLDKAKALLDTGDAAGIPDAIDALVLSADAIWRPANTELARLLQARIDRFNGHMYRSLALAGGFVLLAALLAVFIAHGLSHRLSRLLQVMDRLIANDPEVEVPFLTDTNETGRMASALQVFRESVLERSKLKSEKALQAEMEAERIANENRQQSSRRVLDEAISQASSAMEEMAASVKQNADNASQTEKIARASSDAAASGGEAVSRAVDAMENIASKINIVQEIARQTDLLALNAAVEAARAGEHGRGFAVVASEVRKLAERSQAAAAQISTLSSSSVKTVQEAGSMLERLVPDIRRTASLIAEISSACREQDVGISQINEVIRRLDQVAQENTAAAPVERRPKEAPVSRHKSGDAHGRHGAAESKPRLIA